MSPQIRTAVFFLALIASSASFAGEIVVPADISVHLSAQPDTNVIPGEPVVFTLTVVNLGPGTADQLVLISSDFYDQIDLNFGSVDCQGVVLSVSDGKAFHFNYSWYPTIFEGPLLAGESRTCHITLAMTNQMPAVWPFGFAIPDFIDDINPANNTGTVVLRRGDIAPVAIPMLSPYFLLLLAIGLVTAACHAYRCREGFRRG